MKQQALTQNTKKVAESKSIRVSTITKALIDKKLANLNKSDEFGKVTYDSLLNLLIKEMSKDQARQLQKSTITWTMEEERLKELWSKKNTKGSKVSDEKWKQMLYLGTLKEFIVEYSRIEQ